MNYDSRLAYCAIIPIYKAMLRYALIAISALTTGYTVGRRAIAGEVDKRKQSAIQQAAETARLELTHKASRYLSGAIREYAIITSIKAGLLISFWLAWKTGIMPANVFSIAIALLLMAFILRDAISIWPTTRMVLMELRAHGWQPKRALSEIVAARVFEKVMLQAEETAGKATWRDKLMLSLAGQKTDDLSVEIAGAVAHIARLTSWDDMRPFIVSAGLRAAGLFVLYSGFVFLLLTAGR